MDQCNPTSRCAQPSAAITDPRTFTSGDADVRFRLDAELERFQSQVRDHLSAAMTPELVEQIYTTGVFHDSEFARGLAEKKVGMGGQILQKTSG